MPTNVEIIEAREFLRATPAGVLDLAASEKLLADLAQASNHLTDVQVLLDTRKALAVLTTSELWSLAEQMAVAAGRTMRRTAVVCPAERFDHARFFAMCAERHSLNIRAFLNYEPAVQWLMHGDVL